MKIKKRLNAVSSHNNKLFTIRVTAGDTAVIHQIKKREKNMELNFRKLRADEIEVRVGERKKGFVSLLLYQDARCARNILNETLGVTGWVCQFQSLPMADRVVRDDQGNFVCTQKVNSIYCGIAIKDDTGTWLWRWDCGSEGNFEREKSLASDSFKRAAVMWGVAVELYTAPKIWVKDDSYSWSVSKIAYKDGRISDLRIVDAKGRVVFDYVDFMPKAIIDLDVEDRVQALKDFCRQKLDDGEAAQKTLTAFYNFYENKITEWQRSPNLENLFEKWISKEW